MNMPRPSMLWIYGLIGAFIIGWYVFGDVNDTPLPSDWTTVREMVEKGDVEKIQVVNRDQAQVFLKKEAAEQYRRDTVDKRFKRLPETGVQAHLYDRIGRFVPRRFEERRAAVGTDRAGSL